LVRASFRRHQAPIRAARLSPEPGDLHEGATPSKGVDVGRRNLRLLLILLILVQVQLMLHEIMGVLGRVFGS
jgi:hypothetical protein